MKQIKTKTLFKSVLIIAGFSVLTRLLGFLFRIYLSRELGAELLGVYQVAFSVFMVLIVIVSSGLPLAISKFTAGYRVSKDYKAENSIVSSALIIGIGISLLLVAIILIFQSVISNWFADERCILILITLLPAVVSSAIYSAFRGSLWGTQNYFGVCFTELFEQVARIIIFILMADYIFTQIDGSILAGWSMSLACVLSALFACVVYFANGKRLASPKNYFKPLLHSSVPVTLVRVASSLIQPIIAILFPAMLILYGYTNEQAMEWFGIAMGMTFPLLFLPSTIIGALSFALIPDLSTAIARRDTTLIVNRVKSVLSFSLFVSISVIPFFIGVGGPIGIFLYNNAFSGIYLARASWIMIPLGLSNITSSILNAFNLEVKSFVNNILGGIVLLGIVVLFSGVLGVDALIWGFGGCMTLTTLLNLAMIRRKVNIKLGLTRPLALMVLFLIPTILMTKWIYPFLSFVFPEFLAIGLCGCIGAGGFCVLCWVFKLIDLTSVIIKIKPKKHKKVYKYV